MEPVHVVGEIDCFIPRDSVTRTRGSRLYIFLIEKEKNIKKKRRTLLTVLLFFFFFLANFHDKTDV